MHGKNKEQNGSKISLLKNYSGPDQVISSFALDDIMKQSGGYEYILKSKIPLLDRYLEGGFESGELVVISGTPKSGKTLFGQTLTVNFLDQKHHSLWFEYEVTPKRFLTSFGELPKFFVPLTLISGDMTWLENRIREGIYKEGISVVFIDHLHFLFDMLTKNNASLEIGRIVRFLKHLAIDCNIIIFLICHMKKVSTEQEPDDTDIRDSSLIGAESDTVLILWRDNKTDNEAVLKVRYARRSGVRDKKVRLIKIAGLLKEVEHAVDD